MNIGYDAKRLFHNSSGLGNYSRLLLESLANYYPDNSYFLYNPKPKTIDRFLSSNGTTEVLPREWVYRKIPSLWR